MTQKQIPQISVIMPAYNAERYIRDSVGSILNQTLENLELIVVNDGSKDKTIDILQEIAQQDSRLQVITVENGGPAKARNVGLDAVTSGTEYIMFSDADDALLPDAAERAVAAAKNGADIVLFGFTIVNADGTKNNYNEPYGVYDENTLGSELANLYKANMLNQVWAKLFRADMIRTNEIRFPDYRWGEDRLFMFDCLEKQRKLVMLPDCLYLYQMHEGESLITGYYDRKAEVCIQIDRRVCQLCERYGIKEDGFFRYMFAKSIFSCITNLYSSSCRLSSAEKRAYTKSIVQNAYVHERCKGVSGGVPIQAVSAVLRSKSVSLNLISAQTAATLGKAAPKLFQKIKHKK